MPAEYWDNLTKMSDIFTALKASGTGGGFNCPYQTMQTYIILEQWQVRQNVWSSMRDGLEVTLIHQLPLRFVFRNC